MRPQALIHKSARLTIRLYTVEKKVIELNALKAGLPTSEFVRRACLMQQLAARLTQEELDIYKQLVACSNALTDMDAASGEPDSLTPDAQQLVQRMDALLQKIVT